MQAPGLNEFAKHFYPQLGKKALIIDVRGNGGGNVSPMLIERLRRETGHDRHRPQRRARRPTRRHDLRARWSACCNEFSASDGDLFPYRFQTYKLGKLIGKRSWGGVVGIRGTLPLLDGGVLNRPEFALRVGRQELDHRGPRRRSRHRRGQRPGQGIRRRRSAVEQSDRGHPPGTRDQGKVATQGAALPQEIDVRLDLSATFPRS